MDDEDFWRTAWRYLSGCFIALVVTIGGCQMQQNYIVQVAIEHGVDPVRASCAFVSGSSNQVICVK